MELTEWTGFPGDSHSRSVKLTFEEDGNVSNEFRQDRHKYLDILEFVYKNESDFVLLGPEVMWKLYYTNEFIKKLFISIVEMLRCNRENSVMLYVFMDSYADLQYGKTIETSMNIYYPGKQLFNTIAEYLDYCDKFSCSYDFDALYQNCIERIDRLDELEEVY